MKKLLLIFLYLPLFCFGQSKYETERFIKKHLERYNYCGTFEKIYHNDPFQRKIFTVEFSVEFKNASFIITTYHRIDNNPKIISQKFTIPLKSLKDVYFNRCYDNTCRENIECECLFFESSAKNINVLNGAKDSRKDYFASSWKFQFSKTMREDKLHLRLEEAFRHLVKLSGGNIDEPF